MCALSIISHKNDAMKKLRVIKELAIMAGLALLASGCYTAKQSVDSGRRFHEDAFANVVVKFYKWDNLYITRPDYRQSGFLRPLGRDDLDKAFDSLKVRRELAVVLMGWNYDSIQTAQNVEDWRAILSSQGFRRIVCLRDEEKEKLNGLAIIDDWTRPVETPKHTAGL